jgi:hypothetical protein
MLFDLLNSIYIFLISIFYLFYFFISNHYYDLILIFCFFKLSIMSYFSFNFLILIYNNIKILFLFFKQTKFFNMIWLCLLSFLIFIFIVLVRIVTPRFKLESLSKLGWTYGLIILVLCVIFFFIGYFNF